MACFCLASFISQGRGIKFYDVPTSGICPGMQLLCCLEPTNPHDSDCVALLKRGISHAVLGHLAREDSRYLAPLLRKGMEATG